MEESSIIVKPIITEKSLRDANSGVFTFMVNKVASKLQIAQAVERIFNVHVKDVTTTKIKGKKRIVGRKRMVVHRPDAKKARVKLSSGEKIDLFETGEKEK